MIGSGVSLYAGAALAVILFASFPPSLVAWFRIAGAAVILVGLTRPSLRSFWGRAGGFAALYGLVTLAMNTTFYEAIARIPMGTAVAIEFAGPVAVAALGSRGARDVAALVCAGAGVLLMSGAVISDSLSGLLFALLAGLMWAAYIMLGSRIALQGNSQTSVAVGFAWAAVLTLPVALLLRDPHQDSNLLVTTTIVLGLGLLSAAIPYSLDQIVLRKAGAAYFALLQAILPIVAAIIGAVALRQMLSAAEVIGIALVVLAIGMRRP
ncbi:EamA family transporter [Corynebacterium tapiri]|uniref:EamA family transporter n=2 Tax=Corynebacterium tapiri TaxID=1448266 RepID=A0A5C4U714_9CORY|nr:EamA family transporter [Corynebacterium tapiri]